MPQWVRTMLARQAERARSGGRQALLWTARVTVAATASYLVARVLFDERAPLLAPLTAMLVVQVTPVSLLTSGLDRVLAVVSGVSLAVVFAAVVPLTWWSLGLLIAAALLVGQALALQANLVEVAISAMLVLGVGALGAEAAAWERITETVVGAAVAVAVNLLFPPKVATDDAGAAIDALADAVSGLLRRAADELGGSLRAGRDLEAALSDWLDEARRITHAIPDIGLTLEHAETGRRLNVRALGTADVGPGLRQGLEALEHIAVSVRAMFRSLVDALRERRRPDLSPTDTGDVTAVARVVSQTLGDLAAAVDAFGELVRDDALRGMESETVGDIARLQEALAGMHRSRDLLERVIAQGGDPRAVELYAALLSTVKRLLAEMDLEQRVRRQMRLRRGAAGPRRPRRRPRAAALGGPVPDEDELPPGSELPLPAADADPEADPDAATEVIARVDPASARDDGPAER